MTHWTASAVREEVAPLDAVRRGGGDAIQACKTPGYSLPVADATVGGSLLDEGMSILLPEFEE